ncbi:MAG: hypothetical protein R3B47_05720 [Bacteroidia bacterium]
MKNITIITLFLGMMLFAVSCSDYDQLPTPVDSKDISMEEMVNDQGDMLLFPGDLHTLSTNPKDVVHVESVRTLEKGPYPCLFDHDVTKAGTSIYSWVYSDNNCIGANGEEFRVYIRRARADGKEVANANYYYTGNFNLYHNIRSDSRYAKVYLYWKLNGNWQLIDYAQLWPPF